MSFSVIDNPFYGLSVQLFICLYAFDDKLRISEGGIPAASDNRFADCATDMGVAVSCFCLIAVTIC